MRTITIWFLISLMPTVIVASETNNYREITISRGRAAGLSEKIERTVEDDRIVANNGGRAGGEATNAARVLSQEKINLNLDGHRLTVPIHLRAFRHEVTMKRDGKEWKPLGGYIEIQILSEKAGVFYWSCWQSDSPNPHRFQVVTPESGTSYACCVIRGVQLWRLTESRHSEKIREMNLAREPHPDALPLLPITLITEAVGSSNVGHGGSFFDVTVDGVSDKSGNLQVALHGVKPDPKPTFELRDGKWVFVKPK